MWSSPIHDSGFVTGVLEHLESNHEKYGTSPRMKGMLTVAQEVRALELTVEPITDPFRKLILHSTSHRHAWLDSSTAYRLVSMTLRGTFYSTVNVPLLMTSQFCFTSCRAQSVTISRPAWFIEDVSGEIRCA